MLTSLNTIGSVNSRLYNPKLAIPNKVYYYTFEDAIGSTTFLDSWTGRVGGPYNAGRSGTTNLLTNADNYSGSQSVYFNGNSGTSLILSPNFIFSATGVSVACWVKRSGNSIQDYHLWSIGPFHIYGQSGATEYRANGSNSIKFTLPTTATWTHVVVTLSQTKYVNIYVNGVQTINNQFLTELQSPVSYPGQSPIFGTQSGVIGGAIGAGRFNGYIDEFRVYNKVLTQTEIDAIYTNKAD